MKYSISAKVFEKFPHFSRAVIVARNIHNSDFIQELYDSLALEIEMIEKSNIDNHDERISIWKKAYKTFPSKSSDLRPSIESLIRRIVKREGRKIPFISPIVCISNAVSIKHLMPSGSIDLDKITGNLCLDFAQGDEIFLPFGKDEVTSPIRGEIIYFDDQTKNVMCGSWNSRGGRHTMVTEWSRNVVIDIDAMLDVSKIIDQENAMRFMTELIAKYCNGQITTFFLNKDSPEYIF